MDAFTQAVTAAAIKGECGMKIAAAGLWIEKRLPLCCIYGEGKHGGRESCDPLGELMAPSRDIDGE